VFVKKWVDRDRNGEANGFQGGKSSGRKRKLEEADGKKLRALAGDKKNGVDTAYQYHAKLGVGSRVSVQTVRREMKRLNIKVKTPSKKRKLSPTHRAKRLAFARKLHDVGIGLLTLFTDSTYVKLNEIAGKRRWVLEEDDNEYFYNKNCMQLHFYGGICARGRTELIPVTGTTGLEPYKKKARGVGADEYNDRVLPILLEAGKRLYPSGVWRFMQDGARAHTAKKTKNKLMSEAKEQWIQDWPANSADLNPIEHMWRLIKDNLRGKEFETVPEFMAAAIASWHSIPARVVRSLVGSFGRRCRACVRAEGGYIPY
jgi:inhibitor of nuclear factor kappa-B kinase subunit alpha